MNVVVNGEDQQFTEEVIPLSELIDRLQLSGQPVVVELNGQALLGKEIPDTQINDADRIEIVRIVAGG
jgi:sulfur carrier protein